MAQSLASFLNEQRERISVAKGRKYNNWYTWIEIGSEIGIDESNLYRWASERRNGRPSRIEDWDKLASWFGPGVWQYFAPDISPDLAYLLAHRNDPRVRRVVNEMVSEAQDRGRVNNHNSNNNGGETDLAIT